jgi:iron complex transport system ATP-binding protein
VHEPAALVLDEPTSGLDLTATFHYLDLVRAYIRKGKTLLLVTHHIHEIPPDVKRVVLLKHGNVLQDGEKGSVLTEANLSLLFDCPVALAQANGWYQVLQGTAHRTDFVHPPPNKKITDKRSDKKPTQEAPQEKK